MRPAAFEIVVVESVDGTLGAPVTQARDTCPSLARSASVESVGEDERKGYPIAFGRAFGSSIARRRSCQTHLGSDSLGQALSRLSPLDTIKYEHVQCFHKLALITMSNRLILPAQRVGGYG